MAVRIYDGMNWIRQVIESNSHTLKQLYYQFCMTQDTCVFVWEGKGGNERRRKIYSEYKRNRVRPAEDIFKSIELFQKLISYAPVYQVGVDGYEGDDVIASLAKIYAPNNQVYIHSTDKDFRQLTPFGVMVDSNPIEGCDDRYVRLYKTLVGDPSDNIKGLKGFGKVAFFRLDTKYVLPFFEREDFAGFEPQMAFMEQKHFMKLQEMLPMIATYWKITGFFELSMEQMAPHFKVGVLNQPEAERLIQHYLIH